MESRFPCANPPSATHPRPFCVPYMEDPACRVSKTGDTIREVLGGYHCHPLIAIPRLSIPADSKKKGEVWGRHGTGRAKRGGESGVRLEETPASVDSKTRGVGKTASSTTYVEERGFRHLDRHAAWSGTSSVAGHTLRNMCEYGRDGSHRRLWLRAGMGFLSWKDLAFFYFFSSFNMCSLSSFAPAPAPPLPLDLFISPTTPGLTARRLCPT